MPEDREQISPQDIREAMQDAEPALKDFKFQYICAICLGEFEMDDSMEMIWFHLPRDQFDFISDEELDDDRCSAYPICPKDQPPNYGPDDNGNVPIFEAPVEQFTAYYVKIAETMDDEDESEITHDD